MEYFVTISKTTVEFKDNLIRLIKVGENDDDNIIQTSKVKYYLSLFSLFVYFSPVQYFNWQ